MPLIEIPADPELLYFKQLLSDGKKILLFDVECILCNRFIQIIIKNDKNKNFVFGSLKGKNSTKLREKLLLPVLIPGKNETVYLFNDKKIFQKSSAVLQTVRYMDNLWPSLFLLIIIPKVIRDFIYDLVAKNRYRIFGKTDKCYLGYKDLLP